MTSQPEDSVLPRERGDVSGSERVRRRWFRGAVGVDPSTGEVGPLDVVVDDETIQFIGRPVGAAVAGLPGPPDAARDASVIDVSGSLVLPALVDLDVTLPSEAAAATPAEAAAHLAREAAQGGVATVAVRPDPSEEAEDPLRFLRRVSEVQHALESLRRRAEGRPADHDSGARIETALRLRPLVPAWWIDGETVWSDLEACRQRGAAGVYLPSTPGLEPRRWPGLLRSVPVDLPIFASLADPTIDAPTATVHAGEWSARLGLAGRSATAEAAGVDRWRRLVEDQPDLAGRVVLWRLSTQRGLEALREIEGRAEQGSEAATGGDPLLRVTVSPSHVGLDESDAFPAALADPAGWRLDPPLRTAADRLALRAALFGERPLQSLWLASGHRWIPASQRDLTWEETPPGAQLLSVAFRVASAAALEEAATSGGWSVNPTSILPRLAAVASHGPGRLLGLPPGPAAGDPVARLLLARPEPGRGLLPIRVGRS